MVLPVSQQEGDQGARRMLSAYSGLWASQSKAAAAAAAAAEQSGRHLLRVYGRRPAISGEGRASLRACIIYCKDNKQGSI